MENSTAQADWNDQHGHRTEVMPLIGGEFAGKTPPIVADFSSLGAPYTSKSDPVEDDLAKKAHNAFLGSPDKPWNAVVRVIQQDRDARWEKAYRAAYDAGELSSFRDFSKSLNAIRTRIEAKPKTPEERVTIEEIEILRDDCKVDVEKRLYRDGNEIKPADVLAYARLGLIAELAKEQK